MSIFLEMPFKPDVRCLPKWARVAFAARCAQRVMPVFRSAWREAPREDVTSHKCAVKLVCAAAATAGVDLDELDQLEHQVRVAANKTYDIVFPAPRFGEHYLGETACWAARVSLEAMEVARLAAKDIDAPGHVRQAFELARETASHRNAGLEAEAAMKHDFDALVARANAESWDDDTPVDPDSLGDLWPDGKPSRWPSRGPLMSKKLREELAGQPSHP